MPREYPTIIDLVGNTPIVRLDRISQDVPGTILAKLEFMNPGGSNKDRIGLAMIEAAERDGKLKPGGTIVEPTSGNTGVGLAIAAAQKGTAAWAVAAAAALGKDGQSARIREHDVGRQLLAFGPQAVGHPAADAGKAHARHAGVDLHQGRGVVVGIGPAGVEEGHLVHVHVCRAAWTGGAG